ncbi:TRAP transporter large permease subunit [Pseudogemmobacter sp. W21_MBD1_M6]|uniref:TRAP transporter large permease n=1 Tax=Pseudogemmobacter sp. W21_MBD1_M6 TaxID=3240271 RepID=UPI003F9CB4CC
MELFFLLLLVVMMATALGSGFPVAFALPGAAVITVGLAALTGYLVLGSPDAYFHTSGPYQWLSAGVTNLRGVYWEVERDTLIAIPLFIFMGIMLQRSKIAEDLLVTMAQLFGSIPGGLGISVVFVGALLAATTGIVGATVVAMGLISLPAMLRNNYSPSLASGTIAASGTLGQIIPPSIVLIILADQLASATDQASTMRKVLHKNATGELSMPSIFDVTSTSAGEMFLGALVPGLLLVLIYMIYIMVYAIINPKKAPSVPYEGAYDGTFWRTVIITLVPPLALIFLVLGSIITGIATVNQAGAIGAAGALTMAGYRLYEGKRTTYYPAIMALASMALITFCLANFNMNAKNIQTDQDRLGMALGILATVMLTVSLCWSGWRAFKIEDSLRGVMLETAKTTSLVFIILLGAAMLTAAFRGFGGEDLVRNFLTSLPGGFWVQFVIVMGVIFVLGFFLDFIEIAVVVVPIVAPILLADPSANITAVWLGVMIGLNIQTSFLTPPFGFALFYLRGVAPAVVKTTQIYKGVVPFIALQLLALAVVGVLPPLVNYLPNRMGLLSDAAPPPRNPRLQYCLDQYTTDYIDTNAAMESQLIGRLSALDTSAYPQSVANDLAAGLSGYTDALASLKAANAAELAIKDAAKTYRPKQVAVRQLQKQISAFEDEIALIRTDISRVSGTEEGQARKALLEARRAENEQEIAKLQAQIPESWKQTYADFAELLTAETKARTLYRRNADSAYEAFAKVADVASAGDAFKALEADLRALGPQLGGSDPKAIADGIKDLASRFGDVAGGGDVKKPLDALRKALTASPVDTAKEQASYDDAVKAFEAHLAFVNGPAQDLDQALTAAMPMLKGTVGARAQENLSREQALSIAACASHHRDISLNF